MTKMAKTLEEAKQNSISAPPKWTDSKRTCEPGSENGEWPNLKQRLLTTKMAKNILCRISAKCPKNHNKKL
jgi:hypothetical protein